VVEYKLKEKISLLIRFYWLDDLYQIGKDLKINYFNNYRNYWELNVYQAAFEIAKKIDDQKLLEITRTYIPKYSIKLGGFHGQYYTATVTGDVKLEDSRDIIIANAKKALDKWDDRVYGILKAIINKNGRATFVYLTDEIERVLGYEYIPSSLLPRLSPLNLVFKTGSNKYPDWTMPSEIISTVEEVLNEFQRPKTPRRQKDTPNIQLLKIEKQMSNIVDEIVETRRNINLIFKQKFHTDLKQLINSTKVKRGSINLIEVFLSERYKNYDDRIIKNLRTIMTLRSKKYPIHFDDPAFFQALQDIGFSKLPPDWQDLWETLLTLYLSSIQSFLSLLS